MGKEPSTVHILMHLEIGCVEDYDLFQEIIREDVSSEDVSTRIEHQHMFLNVSKCKCKCNVSKCNLQEESAYRQLNFDELIIQCATQLHHCLSTLFLCGILILLLTPE